VEVEEVVVQVEVVAQEEVEEVEALVEVVVQL
jgi:hypothetical protein